MARLGCGTIQGAVRWKTWSLPTFGWILGTNWIADAPVPITATRSPSRSCSWSHWAEWKALPSKESRPGRSGTLGSLSGPWAAITTSALSGPLDVSSCQRAWGSSQRADSSSVLKRTCGSTPKRVATSRR